MAKHAVAFLKDHEEIRTLFERMDESSKRFQERMDFISSQREKIITEAKAMSKEGWDQIETICKVRQLLPADYSKDKYVLHYDEDLKVVIAQIKEEDSFSKMMSKLFT